MDRLKAMQDFMQVVDSGSFSARRPSSQRRAARTLQVRCAARGSARGETTRPHDGRAMPIIFDAPVMTLDRVIMSSSGFSCRLALLDDSFTLALHRFHEVGRGCSFE
jgi:hypothetical protein